MAIKIQIRRDSSTNWTATNPILSQGELGLELDTNFIKAGNGTDNWNTLPYLFEFTEDLIPLTDNTYDLGSPTKAYRNGYFSGNVGIGRTPTEALDVVGKAIIDMSLTPGYLYPAPGQITFSANGTNRTDPKIRGRAGNSGSSDSNNIGLGLSATNRNNETGFEYAGIQFDVRRSSNAPITTGNAFIFRNYNIPLAVIDHAGNTSTRGLFFISEYSNGNSGTSKTINWNNGNMQTVTMTGNCSFTFTAPTQGVGRLDLKVVQDATGGRNLTFPSTVKWPDGEPAWTSMTGNQRCIVTFRYDGTHYVAVATGNYS